MKKQLKDLSLKVHTTIQPVFVSRKIEQELSVKETKPPIVNQQCVVYSFQCDLCDVGYVGYTRVHLHNRVKRHKQQSSAIAKHCTRTSLRSKRSRASERNSGHAKAKSKKVEGKGWGRGKKGTLARKPLDFEKRPLVFTVEFIY